MIEEIRGMPYHAVSVAPMLESIKNGPTLSNDAACKGMAQLLAQLLFHVLVHAGSPEISEIGFWVLWLKVSHHEEYNYESHHSATDPAAGMGSG